jgi:ribosomal protein S18 acetylase RimI-like enzyme
MPIRRADIADAAEIAEVGIACWNETFRGIVPDSYLDRMDVAERTQWTENYLRDPEVDFYTVVAEQDGAIVGYAAGGPNRSDDGVYQGELYTLYLLRKAHKQGLGRQLVQAVASALAERGYKNMLVGVLRDNPARGFYERLGAVYVREGVFIIDGVEITEMAYGWPDLRVLLPEHEGR